MKKITISLLLAVGTLYGLDLDDRLKEQAISKGWKVSEDIEKNFTTILHADPQAQSDGFFVFYGPAKENGRHLTETKELDFEGKIGHQEMYLRNIHPVHGTDLIFRKFKYEDEEYAYLFSKDGADGVGSAVTLILGENGTFYFFEFYFYHEDPVLAYRAVREFIEPGGTGQSH
jgi:hypothetical protein